MSDGPNIARIAALIGDPGRAEMLSALSAGRALTATELAQTAGVTKQTVSAHLAKLLDARLLSVSSEGRHRYFRLADDDVAQLLESLMGVAQRAGALRLRPGPREPALRKARICYDHLAGELAVLMFDSLCRRGLLEIAGREARLMASGRPLFESLGIALAPLEGQRRALCRCCLDWSERRNHLAGALGAALLTRCLELGWARRDKDSRVLRFDAAGEAALHARFALAGT